MTFTVTLLSLIHLCLGNVSIVTRTIVTRVPPPLSADVWPATLTPTSPLLLHTIFLIYEYQWIIHCMRYTNIHLLLDISGCKTLDI